MNTIPNPWDKVPIEPPYVLHSDVTSINRYNHSAAEEYVIKVDALPEPFFGNIDAPVILLGLNPGYDERDPEVHSNPEFQSLIRNNLILGPAEYPFYFLDPGFESPGRTWW